MVALFSLDSGCHNPEVLTTGHCHNPEITLLTATKEAVELNLDDGGVAHEDVSPEVDGDGGLCRSGAGVWLNGFAGRR